MNSVYRTPHPCRCPPVIILIFFIILSFLARSAHSHGSLSSPPSRPYFCWKNPSHPACPGSQAAITYDWNSAGRRCGAADFECNKTSPPPGTLCSGAQTFPGSEYYDVPRNYHRTDVRVGANVFEYHTTAEHWGTYYVYLSKDITDLSRLDLTLTDFDQVCVYEYDQGASEIRQFPCTLPARERQEQLIYVNWRTRETAPEQFMTCADVRILGVGGGENDEDRQGGENGRDTRKERRKQRRQRRERREKNHPSRTPKSQDPGQDDLPGMPTDSKCAVMHQQCGGEDRARRKIDRKCCEGKCIGTQWWAACKPERLTESRPSSYWRKRRELERYFEALVQTEGGTFHHQSNL